MAKLPLRSPAPDSWPIRFYPDDLEVGLLGGWETDFADADLLDDFVEPGAVTPLSRDLLDEFIAHGLR